MRNMRKWMSGLLALVMTLALCAGCGGAPEEEVPETPTGIYYDVTGIDPNETVMEVDGVQVPAEQYFYWLAYNCSGLEYTLNQYRSYAPDAYGAFFDEDGDLIWDADMGGGVTLAQYAGEQAEYTVTHYAAIENAAKEYGVTLTDEDRASMEENLTASIEQAGGEEAFQQGLALMGLSRESFDHISSLSYLYGHMVEMVLEEGSALYLPQEGYDERYAYADHILLSNKKDQSTGELLGEEELAAQRQQAEELLAQLRSSEDPETLFAQLADEYSADGGRASNPDGYVFGKGEMVQEFEDAAFSMKPGEISEIVETTHGYHILLRKDLAEKLAADESLKAQMAEGYLRELLEERQSSASISRSEKIEGLDIAAFYNGYVEASEALEAANQPEDQDDGQDGGEDSEDGEAAPGSTDGTAE